MTIVSRLDALLLSAGFSGWVLVLFFAYQAYAAGKRAYELQMQVFGLQRKLEVMTVRAGARVHLCGKGGSVLLSHEDSLALMDKELGGGGLVPPKAE